MRGSFCLTLLMFDHSWGVDIKWFDSIASVQGSPDYPSIGNSSQYVKYLGQANSSFLCAQLCLGYNKAGRRCHSFSSFSAEAGSFAHGCFGQIDRAWMPVYNNRAQSGQVLWPCESDAGCSFNGICRSSGQCDCDPAWEGIWCEKLALLPVNRTRLGYRYTRQLNNVSSWGGAVLYDDVTDRWHMWASEMTKGCGINAW